VVLRINAASLRFVIFGCALFMLVIPLVSHAQSIQANSAIVSARIAPGESMPVRVQLSNFGSSSRVDATITYQVTDSTGLTVVSENETVAVETTATFIHTLTLQANTLPGSYKLLVSVAYSGQIAPAVSSYQFTVERKILGVFISDFLKYGFITLVSILFVLGLVWIFERYHHNRQLGHDYSHVPSKTRIYYEIIGDVIQQMRLHEGDTALKMATEVGGLHIDPNTGKVIEIDGDPATVVASLVSEYEQVFGKKINLSFAKNANGKAMVKAHA
jgi:hypothetical protein